MSLYWWSSQSLTPLSISLWINFREVNGVGPLSCAGRISLLSIVQLVILLRLGEIPQSIIYFMLVHFTFHKILNALPKPNFEISG